MNYLPDGKYVVIPDIQSPYHDARLVDLFTAFIEDFKPDGLLCVGDEADSPEASRWNKGTAGEYGDTLEAGLQATYDVMQGFSVALNGGWNDAYSEHKPFVVMRSNHGDRIQKYLSRYAPAMARTSWNQYPAILGYGEVPRLHGRSMALPIEYTAKPYAFAKGWVMMHGDEGNMIQSAGGTALSLAKKIGASVVCGHTHRAGIQHHNQGHSGRINHRLYGLEVGHMMDLKQAGYLKSGAANWQSGFGILRIYKGVVYPQLVLVNDRKFSWNGVVYAC